MTAPLIEDNWTGEDVSIGGIERELARLRYSSSAEGAQPNLRTSVMTHIAWAPPEWLEAAEETLAGLAERHPSRTLLLVPKPDLPDGIDAVLSVRCYPVGDRAVCGEVIQLTLRGARAQAPASIVLPLLVSDLPVFCRWRGEAPFGAPEFEQLVDTVDRIVVDTAEWEDVDYHRLAGLFTRTAVSDIAWSRLFRWRSELARYWPSIREQEIHVSGPPAEGALLRAWLSARLDRPVRAVEPAAEVGVRLGGERLPVPRGADPTPSDLLSAELDRYGRDAIYEEAVNTAAG